MDKISLTIKKISNYPFFLALCMNLIVLAISLVVGSGKFESLDDYFMSSVLTGAYGGEYDVHLYFTNVIYGYFLRPFYTLLPHVSWYSVFQTLSVFASFTAASYAILKNFEKKLGTMLAVLLLICVSPDFYLHVAFTQCAGITTAAGIFLLAIGNTQKNKKYLLTAFILVAAGIVFRKEMVLLGTPTLAAILFLGFIRDKKIWIGTTIALVLLAFVYVGLDKFNVAHYEGKYEYYAAYQGPRSYFGDGAFYDPESFVAELDDRGMNTRDFRYLRAWYFYDNNVFSLDSMKALIKIADRNRYVPNYAKMPFAIVRTMSDSLLRGSVWCWALLCFTLIFFSNKKNWWVPWVSIGLIAIPYTYLLLVNRVVEHVEVGIWALTVFFVLIFVNQDDILNKKQTKSFLQIIGLVCIASIIISGTYIVYGKTMNKARSTQGTHADWINFQDYAKDHYDDVFLLPFDRYKEYASYINHFYESVAPGSWNNIFSTGYWNIHLPAMDQELKKRGVTNIIKDVVNPNVYVVADEYALSLVPYYQDHYHQWLKIDTLNSFGKLKLLKYQIRGETDENANH